MTDVTRAWSILEYFRRNWMEPVWLGCSLERYEEIKSYDDFMAWLDERPEHANSDLGLFWRMSVDVGLDKYGRGLGRYVSWGYLPHEDKYNKPTIEGRNAALIMKSGVYDGADRHPQADGSGFIRARTSMHAWYDEPGGLHPFDRTTKPVQKNTRRLRTASIPGRRPCATTTTAAWRPGRSPRQLVAGGKHGEAWQHHDPLVLDMYKQLGGASVMLRHFARMHEGVKLYRAGRALPARIPAERSLVHQADGEGRPRLGRHRGDPRRAVPLDRGEGGKIKNYQIIAPTTWNVGPRADDGERGPIEEALIGTPIADVHDPVEVGHVCRSYDSCLVCTVHAHDARTGEELARFRTA